MATAEQPPYFNISPDAALADLGAPTGSGDFAAIAEACARGRADLASRGLEEDGRKQLRLFSTWEITRYLIPVATPHFRRVLKANPNLPQGTSETEGGAKWFTLDEVLRLRAHFATEGSKAKEYLPYRPKGQPAKMARVDRQLASVSRVELMFQYSWALTYGSGNWTCQSCSATWNMIPVGG